MNTIAINAMKTISDNIIHLGAGLGTSTPLYQQLGYKQLVLVEPSLELVKLLSKKFSQQQNVHIKNIAISAQEAYIEFNNYSNPRYDSQLLLESEFIKQTNLYLQAKKHVPAITLAQLSAELKLTNTQYNILIIELNGYEAQFLTLLPLSQLAVFSKIIISLQATARYVNQTNATTLNTVLAANGFRFAIIESNQYIYEKDEQLVAILQTQAQQLELIEKLQHERDALIQEKNALQKDLRSMTEACDEQAHWNQTHKDRAESLKRDIDVLKKEYAEGERMQSLALKLQAKAQVDLEHLRQQYQQKLNNEQKLIDLIQELQLKLQAAANYYHQLRLQHPELDAEHNQGNANNTIDVEIINKPIESEISKKNAYKKRK